MKCDKIFIGDIGKCTTYKKFTPFEPDFVSNPSTTKNTLGYIDIDDELYKENAILLQIADGIFIDLDSFHSFFNYLKIYKEIHKNSEFHLGELIMNTAPTALGDLFIEENSLKPYYLDIKSNNISIHKLTRQIKKQPKS